MVGFDESYRKMKAAHPTTEAILVGKHSALVECFPGSAKIVRCKGYVAISDDRTLSVAVEQEDGDTARLTSIVASRADVALGRLPVA